MEWYSAESIYFYYIITLYFMHNCILISFYFWCFELIINIMCIENVFEWIWSKKRKFWLFLKPRKKDWRMAMPSLREKYMRRKNQKFKADRAHHWWSQIQAKKDYLNEFRLVIWFLIMFYYFIFSQRNFRKTNILYYLIKEINLLLLESHTKICI